MDEPKAIENAARGWMVCALVGALAIGACGPDREDEAGAPGTSEVCSAGTVARRPLVLSEGSHAYVEPTNLMRVGPDLVVVGTPTYTWEARGPRATMTSAGAHIAAYLDDDAPRLVEKPIDVEAVSVRGVVLDERRWGVLFSVPDSSVGTIGAISDVWYAEYDGERWGPAEQLPLPEQGVLFTDTSSRLVSDGGVLRWIVVRNPEGAALAYERRDGVWRFSTAEDEGVEAAALALGPSGAWLALSGVDPGIEAPKKSVRVFVEEDGWRLVSRNPTTEPFTEIRPPSLMVLPGGVTVTWLETVGQGVVMARVGIGVDRPGRLVLVDDSAPVVRPFARPDGEPAWIVQHNNALARLSELRLVRLDGGGTRIAQAFPNPYTGYYAAMATGPEEVFVTGAEFSPDPARPTVRSLTLRLSPSCR